MATDQPRRKRQSPAVYRRRRLVLLVGLLAVVIAVWLMIAQPWRGSSAEATGAQGGSDKPAGQTITDLPVPSGTTPTPTPTTTSADPESTVGDAKPVDAASTPSAPPTTPAPDPSATPAAKPCKSSDILVEAVTDADSYAAGQNPQLSIRLTNHSAKDCTLNVGTSTQTFTITSGSDTWWRSTDCQTEPSDMVVLVAAGQTVSSAAPLTWDRTRSSVDSCSGDRQRAPGGGATYHLDVSIGGIASLQLAQLLLY